MSETHDAVAIVETAPDGLTTVTIQCATGDLSGYLHGAREDVVQAAKDIVAGHLEWANAADDPGLLDISHGEMSTSNVPRRPSANEMVWNEMSPKPPGERDAPPPTG